MRPPPDLTVYHSNDLPIRIAQGPDERIYVSDTQSGSVFIYTPELTLEQEINAFERPLGVAVDEHQHLYVGSDTNDRVEVYDAQGFKLREFGTGEILMPNDIAIGPPGRIYIADSLSDAVWVYAPNGSFVQRIGTTGEGPGQFRFPAAVTLAQRDGAWELYVADQGNARIQVFTPDGVFLRTFGSKVADFSRTWHGRFIKIQSLAMDAQDRLHVLDSTMHTIQILDPDDGTFLGSYGMHGPLPGELKLPLDLMINAAGETVVTNAGNQRVETIEEGAGS